MTMQVQVGNAWIAYRVPLDISTDFTAYIARLEVALHGRVEIAELEVELAEIVSGN